VILGDSAAPPVGANVAAGGKEVGRLTSVAFSPRVGATVALAFVRRAVEPPAEVVVEWEGGSSPASVEALPLVP
jgi:glycine cleavage system aminomethyltransferase T